MQYDYVIIRNINQNLPIAMGTETPNHGNSWEELEWVKILEE